MSTLERLEGNQHRKSRLQQVGFDLLKNCFVLCTFRRRPSQMSAPRCFSSSRSSWIVNRDVARDGASEVEVGGGGGGLVLYLVAV